MKNQNPLLTKSYDFALRVLNLCFEIQDSHREYDMSRQLLRSGTAIGALSEEAQQAESKADFVHKLSIANKEAFETHYWLRLLRDCGRFSHDFSKEIDDCEELKRLLVSIIKSSRGK